VFAHSVVRSLTCSSLYHLPLSPSSRLLHSPLTPSLTPPRTKGDLEHGLNGVPFFLFPRMALSDSKLLFVNGKPPLKSIHFDAITDKDRIEQPAAPTTTPSLFGVQLKYISYVFLSFLLPYPPINHSRSRPKLSRPLLTYILPSLVTLAVQNATLSLLMHYSRVSMPPSRAYSAASAVLATELLKGLISLLIALIRVRPTSYQHAFVLPSSPPNRLASSPLNPNVFLERCRIVGKEVFRPDCWKLAIPAILYG
jgi:hypothetical protein